MSETIKIPSWVGQVIITAILALMSWFMGNIMKNQNILMRKMDKFDVQLDYIHEKQMMINENHKRINDLERGSVSATADRFRKTDALDMVNWIEGTFQENGVKYEPYKFKAHEEL